MEDVAFNNICIEDRPVQVLVHLGAFFRYWAVFERSRALYNRSLLKTEKSILPIPTTGVALCGLLKAKHVFQQKTAATNYVTSSDQETTVFPRRAFRVIHCHEIHGTYDYAKVKALAASLFATYEETIFMMANRMCVDCTKVEPITAEELFQIARKLRGWTFAMVSSFIPIFGKDLIQRYNLGTPGKIRFQAFHNRYCKWLCGSRYMFCRRR